MDDTQVPSDMIDAIPDIRNPKPLSVTKAEVIKKVNGYWRISLSDGTVQHLRPIDFDYSGPSPGDEVIAYYNRSHRSGLWRAALRE